MTRDKRDELVRLATLIDTEGCIGIYQSKTRTGTSWPFLVSISQSAKPKFDVGAWIEEKQRTHGGSLNRTATEGKPQWQLRWTGRHAIHLVRSLLPYFQLKKEQAALFLRAWNEWPRGNYWAGVPDEITTKRNEWKSLVNSYNSYRKTKPSRASDAASAANDEEGVTTMHGPQ